MSNQNLIDSARKCIKECMNVEPDENVLIITDKQKLRIAEVLRHAVIESKANPLVIFLPDPDERIKNPITKLDKMLMGALNEANVVLTPFSEIEGEFRPFRISIIEMATKKKSFRLGHMIGIEEESLRDGGLTADYKKIEKLTDCLAEILSKAKKIKIISGSGKPLEANLMGWEEKASSDCGILKKTGSFGNLPAGEAYIAAKGQDISGEVCIDLFADPIGGLVDPIILTIENGVVTHVDGKDKDKKDEFEAKLIEAEEKAKKQNIPIKNVRKVAEIGIGTNPKAKVGRIIIETEKLKGTAHIALGDNSFFGGLIKAPIHYDLIINKPTIMINEKEIMNNGSIVDIPTLRARFEENFNNLTMQEISNISNEFFVRRATNDVIIKNDGQLYKKWVDSEMREHETRVGDEDTAAFAARIFKINEYKDEIKITELAKKLGEPKDNVKKVLKVLESYRLVDIQRKDIFEGMQEIKKETGTNFEKMGQDLTKIKAIDEQTELLILRTSEDLKKLNASIGELNITETLTLINKINEKIDELDTNKVSGTIGIQSVPPFINFGVSKEFDVRDVFGKIKMGLNELRLHLMTENKVES